MYQSRNDEASIHQPQRGYFIRMVTPLLVIFALLAVGVPRAMAQDAAGNTIFLPFVTNSGASVEVADESDENDVGNAFPQYVEPPPADGEVQAAIVNGQLVTSPPPWIAVGWRDSATDGGPWCTGTLIFSQWVISAGHCGALDGVRLGGTTNRNGQFYSVERSFVLSPNGGNQDIALHKLSQSASQQPVAINRNTGLLNGAWVEAMGYGTQDPNRPSDGRLYKTGWLRVINRDEWNSAFTYGNAGSATTVCYGDSGGPTLAWDNGSYILAGVNSYTHGNCDRGISGAADVSENMAWIDSIINSNGGPGSSANAFRLVSGHAGKCVDIFGANPSDGTKIIQWSCHSGWNQKWEQVPANGGFMLRNPQSGKCLDVAGASRNDGDTVLLWPCTGGDNQIMTWSGNSLRFKHSGKCLDVAGVSGSDGANIIQWACHGGSNQLFNKQ
jgi:hypothetical protein